MSGDDSENEKLKATDLFATGGSKAMASESVTPPRIDRRPGNKSALQGGAVVTPSALDMTIP